MSKTRATTNKKPVNPTLGNLKFSLVAARNHNNKKAISRDFISGNPKVKNPDKVYSAWCKAIHEIYTIIQPWAVSFNDAKADNDTLQAVYEAVVPMWMELATDIDPRMFVRANDVHRLLGFSLKFGGTSKGSVDVATSQTEFRRLIETMFGVRIAQGAVLTAEEHELVAKYDATTTNLAKAQDRLNGTVDSKGEHKDGLVDGLNKAEAEYSKMRDIAIKLGVKENIVDEHELLKGYAEKIEDIKSKITKTKVKITEYNQYLKDNKKKYDTIMKKVNEITE